jgi:hypothetical protein
MDNLETHASNKPHPKGNVDWILVIDTSASMVGEGGTKNIFAQVKQTVSDFVNKSDNLRDVMESVLADSAS